MVTNTQNVPRTVLRQVYYAKQSHKRQRPGIYSRLRPET